MNPALLAVLLLVGQASVGGGVSIERTVRRTSIDWLGKHEEVQRKERLLIKGQDLALVDLTFGDRLIIRCGPRKVWKLDPLAREYAVFTFEEAAALRKAALDEVRAAKARVPGTVDEKELAAILEGFDQFSSPPSVELRSAGSRREVIINGDRVRASVEVNESIQAPGWIGALAEIGAFHPSVAEKLRGLGGVPTRGTLRYALFLERVIEEFETTSIRNCDIPEIEFELPAGLTRTPLRGFEPPAERKLSKPPAFRQSFKEDEAEKSRSNSAEKKEK